MCHRVLTRIVERSIHLFYQMKKKKKKSLKYLLKARSFVVWTLLDLGRDTNKRHTQADILLDIELVKQAA